MYSIISQSTIITSPIGFNIALTNVDATLKQRCVNVVPTLCNVVPTLCNVVSSLCNVVWTLFQRRAMTLYQRWTTLKIWRRILFQFQRRFNVISTLIHNAETQLIRLWNVDRANYSKYCLLNFTTFFNFPLKYNVKYK